MSLTTYQHDYIPPLTKRNDLMKLKKQNGKASGCQCTTENKIEVPKDIRKQCNVEWTGIAPMGRLIYPRNIPTKFSNNQLDFILKEDQNYCQRKQQNRFLKNLQSEYPDLYDRLNEMPKDELNRRLDNDRMCTTYQVDFCDVSEYPEGIYESPKTENEMDGLKKKNSYIVMNTDSCEKSYKPLKISFADSSRFINSGNSSHWQSKIFTKKAMFSEYMDTISKIGCAIIKNSIHDHKKCNKTNCYHKLIHCKNFN